MTAAAFLAPAGRGILRISGDDRVAFLQGLVSNDVAKALPATAEVSGRVLYAGFLSAQGRILHDFFIAAIGDALYLDCEADGMGDLHRRLSLYRLRSKVTLAPVSDAFASVLIYGEQALQRLNLPPAPGSAVVLGGGVLYVDPRTPALGARAIVPLGEVNAFGQMGLTEGVAADYDQLRLSLGVPDGSRDLPFEKALPLENGFDQFNAVDWKKGCYVGQELTARMKYRALVRRRLVSVRIDGPLPPPATPVLLDEQEVGEMRSAAGSRGLALLRIDAIDAAAKDSKTFTAATARLALAPMADAPALGD